MYVRQVLATALEWERLATMPPGAALATALAALDFTAVPNDVIVDVLQAQHRQSAHEQARLLAAMVEVGRMPGAGGGGRLREVGPWGAGEIAAALTWTARAADRELDFATTLVVALPQMFQALLDGRIDRPKAWVFADHLDPQSCGLAADQVEAICARLLPPAPGWTTGQLAARLLRAVIAIDPQAARRRYDRAVRERAVTAYLDRNGTVTVSAVGLAADEAAVACERLERLAATVKRAGHPGRMKQIKADLFVAMLDGRYHQQTQDEIVADLLRQAGIHGTADGAESGPDSDVEAQADAGAGVEPEPGVKPDPGVGEPGRGRSIARAGVEIRVGLSTLLGRDSAPGEIPGLGPVGAGVARGDRASAAPGRAVEVRGHGCRRLPDTRRSDPLPSPDLHGASYRG